MYGHLGYHNGYCMGYPIALGVHAYGNDETEAYRRIKRARGKKKATAEGVVATTGIAVAGAAAPFAAAFPVGTAVVAGAATAAAIAGIVAAARKGSASRKAAVRYFKKHGVKDAEDIDGWIVRAARWSSAKRRRKAEQLHRALRREKGKEGVIKDLFTFRSERKLKVKLAVLSVLEKEQKNPKNRKRRVVKEDPATEPSVADTSPDIDTAADDASFGTAPIAVGGALLAVGGIALFFLLKPPGRPVAPRGA